jgi:hypothetical protein
MRRSPPFVPAKNGALRGFPPFRQRGAVLVVGLVMLVVVVMLGLVSMRSVLLQERLAGGFAAQNLALQASETSLRAAERVIQGGGAPREAHMSLAPGWFSVRGNATIALPASPSLDSATFWDANTYPNLSQEARALADGTPSVKTGNPIVDYYGATDAAGGFARFAANRQEDVPLNPADVSIGRGVPAMTPLWRVYGYGRGITPGIWAGLQSEYKQK